MCRVKFLIIVSFTWILAGLLSPANEVFAQNTLKPTIKIKVILTIGGQKDTAKSHIFSFPFFVCTDKSNNIFIADRQFREIRVFNPFGRYIRTIGRSGKGPGEFTEISGMLINGKNQLLTVDRINMRFTLFDSIGDVLDTKYFPKQKRFSPWEIRQAPDGNYFMLYYPYDATRISKKKNGDLIHILNSRLSKAKGEFFPAPLAGDVSNKFINNFIGGPDTGFFTILSDTVVFAVPFLFRGNIYKFHKTNKNWSLEARYKGFLFNRDLLTVVNANKVHRTESQPAGLETIGGPDGLEAAYIHNEADEIFLYQHKYILVFTYLAHGGRRELGIELFNTGGQYLGYYPVDLFQTEKKIWATSPVIPSWISSNKIYFIDFSSGFARVVVAKIQIKE